MERSLSTAGRRCLFSANYIFILRGVRSGFDNIAFVYDQLAKLVFGKTIRNAQIHFLNFIPHKSSVLIVGGGTGWILSELAKVNPACNVWYVEASTKMLEQAKETIKLASLNVQFIHGTGLDLQPFADTPFDAVIANFYFDLFMSPTLETALHQIVKVTRHGGLLFASDFLDNRIWWQRMLLSLMYTFFRWCCSIEASNLPDWQTELKKNGFKEMKSKLFYKGFIKSSVYQLA
jgi:ubiquinone/menaquinone biosynthesis C-methylase UbiE